MRIATATQPHPAAVACGRRGTLGARNGIALGTHCSVNRNEQIATDVSAIVHSYIGDNGVFDQQHLSRYSFV